MLRPDIINSVIILLLFAEFLYAAESPSSKEQQIIDHFGMEYFELRDKLPIEGGYFSLDEALIERKKNIDILTKLLNDKNITKVKGMSLFESLNINSSDTLFDECLFIFNGITSMILAGSDYQNIIQKAIGDEYRKLNETDKKLIKSTMNMEYEYYSMLFQKNSGMQKECADIFAQNIFRVSDFSERLNKEALNSFKGLIDKGCINIKILDRYTVALMKEGKFTGSQKTTSKQVIDLYSKYFDQLSDLDLNQAETFEFLQRISSIKEKEKDYDSALKINKKISRYLLLNKMKLEDQPQWIRRGYLRLLSKTIKLKKLKQHKDDDNEITDNLRKVFNKKGNIFIVNGEPDYQSPLSDDEKQFMKLIE